MSKKRDLMILALIYALSFALGYGFCRGIGPVVWRFCLMLCPFLSWKSGSWPAGRSMQAIGMRPPGCC